MLLETLREGEKLRTSIRTIALTLMLTAVAAVQARTYSGTVVGISDGDTIKVLDEAKRQHTVRLAGIDAPEKKQAYGQRSRQSLSDMLFQRVVIIDTHKNDKYGREVGKVMRDGRDVNLEQLRRGMAWHYKDYDREQSPADREMYAATEDAARSARIGLWADARPIPPWDFRRKKAVAK